MPFVIVHKRLDSYVVTPHFLSRAAAKAHRFPTREEADRERKALESFADTYEVREVAE